MGAHDGVGITFWLANGIMFASAIFFLLESQNVPKRWSASVTVAGLVSLVAFYNYCYMRAIWVQTQQSPQIFRYTDWLITVPLQVIEFYLIISAVKPNTGKGLLWRLMTASLIMLVAGYLGDTGMPSTACAPSSPTAGPCTPSATLSATPVPPLTP